jgi:hypothetical protein
MRFTLAGHDEQLDASSSEEGGESFDTRKERKFVRKLDCILVTWAFFAYLLKVSLRRFRLQLNVTANSLFSAVDDRRHEL